MEPQKSPESVHDQEYKSTADSAGTRRSYDCSFCKRGFTNAQALGGHMNIHRKDKAKHRNCHHRQEAEPSNQSNYGNLRYFPEVLSRTEHLHQRQFGCVRPGGGQVNHQAYLPLQNPNSQIGNFYCMPIWRAESAVDADLRMGIGHDGERVGNEKVTEIDLELRLGHERR